MAKISFKPLGSRVLIEPTEQEEMTASGIILPETAKEKPQQGKVLAAGPGDRNEDGKRVEMDVKVGGSGKIKFELAVGDPPLGMYP